jgi:hypothetical protein
MKKFLAATALVIMGTSAAYANITNIQGNVQSRCSIITETSGVYGNPTADKLSTAPSDAGVLPIIRVDVIQADSYKVKISWPNSFSSSPPLSDSVVWDGEVEVSAVSDANMSSYEIDKVEYENHTEYDLTLSGSTWFKVTSTAEYGADKSFPGGLYTAIVTSECIPK